MAKALSYKSGTGYPIYVLISLLVVCATVVLLTTPYPQFSFLPAFLIGIFLFLYRFSTAGFYIIVFLLPFGAFRNLWGPLASVKIHWVLAFLLIVIIGVQLIVEKRFPRWLKMNLWPLLIFFLLANLVSTLLTDYPESARNSLLRLVVACFFIGLSLLLVDKKGFKTTLPKVLSVSISLSAFFAVIGYFFYVALFAADATAGEFTRGTGGTTWASSLSLSIVFAFPLLVYLIIHAQTVKSRLFYIFLASINIGGMVTTFSRGGALILSIILLLCAIHYRRYLKPKHFGFVFLFAGIIFTTVIAVTPPSYWERQVSLTKWQDSSIGRRQAYLIVGWQSFKEHPFLGSGTGTFRDLYSKSNYARVFAKEGSTTRRFAHNTYVEVLVGSGILGFLIFLLLLHRSWRNFSSAYKIFEENQAKEMMSIVFSYQMSFLAVLLYFFLHSGIDNKFFLLILPISAISLRLARESRDSVQSFTNL